VHGERAATLEGDGARGQGLSEQRENRHFLSQTPAPRSGAFLLREKRLERAGDAD